MDYSKGCFIGRIWDNSKNGPCLIRIKDGNVYDITSKEIPTVRDLLELELTHDRGSLAMARSEPLDSASAQFYISLQSLPELDGRYAVFGKVINGMETLEKIEQGDFIIKAKLKEN